MADAIDKLGTPEAFTLIQIRNITQDSGLIGWLDDRKNRRTVPYRLEKCGYVPVRNDTAKDGLWVVNKKRQAIYVKISMTLRDQLKAAAQIAADRSNQ